MKFFWVLAASCLVSLPVTALRLEHEVIVLPTEELVTPSGVQVTLKPIRRVYKNAVVYHATYMLGSGAVPADRIAADIQDLFTRKRREITGHGTTDATVSAMFRDPGGIHSALSCTFAKVDEWAPRCVDHRRR